MTRAEWLLREQSTILGFMWTLLHPLFMFGVLYWVFGNWMRAAVPDYPAFLMVGVVLFGFFSSGTHYGLSSLQRRRGIAMNFLVPRELLVFSAVLSVWLSYAVECALLLAMLCALGIAPKASWAFFPLLLAAQAALVLGLSLLLSLCGARMTDFERVWGLVTWAVFFLTPVFYRPDAVGLAQQAWVRANPIAALITASRQCLIDGVAPETNLLVVLGAWSAASLGLGWPVFRALRSRIGDFIAL